MREELNQLIKESYDEFIKYATTISNNRDNPYDIVNDVLVDVLSFSDDKLEHLSDYIFFYILKMIKLSTFSSTSSYQQKYNKVFNNIDGRDIWYVLNKSELTEDDDVCEDKRFSYEAQDHIKIILNKHCNWYEREIYKMYNKPGMTYKKMSKLTTIPVTDLFLTYKEVKKKIKKHITLWVENQAKEQF